MWEVAVYAFVLAVAVVLEWAVGLFTIARALVTDVLWATASRRTYVLAAGTALLSAGLLVHSEQKLAFVFRGVDYAYEAGLNPYLLAPAGSFVDFALVEPYRYVVPRYNDVVLYAFDYAGPLWQDIRLLGCVSFGQNGTCSEFSPFFFLERDESGTSLVFSLQKLKAFTDIAWNALVYLFEFPSRIFTIREIWGDIGVSFFARVVEWAQTTTVCFADLGYAFPTTVWSGTLFSQDCLMCSYYLDELDSGAKCFFMDGVTINIDGTPVDLSLGAEEACQTRRFALDLETYGPFDYRRPEMLCHFHERHLGQCVAIALDPAFSILGGRQYFYEVLDGSICLYANAFKRTVFFVLAAVESFVEVIINEVPSSGGTRECFTSFDVMLEFFLDGVVCFAECLFEVVDGILLGNLNEIIGDILFIFTAFIALILQTIEPFARCSQSCHFRHCASNFPKNQLREFDDTKVCTYFPTKEECGDEVVLYEGAAYFYTDPVTFEQVYVELASTADCNNTENQPPLVPEFARCVRAYNLTDTSCSASGVDGFSANNVTIEFPVGGFNESFPARTVVRVQGRYGRHAYVFDDAAGTAFGRDVLSYDVHHGYCEYKDELPFTIPGIDAWAIPSDGMSQCVADLWECACSEDPERYRGPSDPGPPRSANYNFLLDAVCEAAEVDGFGIIGFRTLAESFVLIGDTFVCPIHGIGQCIDYAKNLFTGGDGESCVDNYGTWHGRDPNAVTIRTGYARDQAQDAKLPSSTSLFDTYETYCNAWENPATRLFVPGVVWRNPDNTLVDRSFTWDYLGGGSVNLDATLQSCEFVEDNDHLLPVSPLIGDPGADRCTAAAANQFMTLVDSYMWPVFMCRQYVGRQTNPQRLTPLGSAPLDDEARETYAAIKRTWAIIWWQQCSRPESATPTVPPALFPQGVSEWNIGVPDNAQPGDQYPYADTFTMVTNTACDVQVVTNRTGAAVERRNVWRGPSVSPPPSLRRPAIFYCDSPPDSIFSYDPDDEFCRGDGTVPIPISGGIGTNGCCSKGTNPPPLFELWADDTDAWYAGAEADPNPGLSVLPNTLQELLVNLNGGSVFYFETPIPMPYVIAVASQWRSFALTEFDSDVDPGSRGWGGGGGGVADDVSVMTNPVTGSQWGSDPFFPVMDVYNRFRIERNGTYGAADAWVEERGDLGTCAGPPSSITETTTLSRVFLSADLCQGLPVAVLTYNQGDQDAAQQCLSLGNLTAQIFECIKANDIFEPPNSTLRVHTDQDLCFLKVSCSNLDDASHPCRVAAANSTVWRQAAIDQALAFAEASEANNRGNRPFGQICRMLEEKGPAYANVLREPHCLLTEESYDNLPGVLLSESEFLAVYPTPADHSWNDAPLSVKAAAINPVDPYRVNNDPSPRLWNCEYLDADIPPVPGANRRAVDDFDELVCVLDCTDQYLLFYINRLFATVIEIVDDIAGILDCMFGLTDAPAGTFYSERGACFGEVIRNVGDFPSLGLNVIDDINDVANWVRTAFEGSHGSCGVFDWFECAIDCFTRLDSCNQDQSGRRRKRSLGGQPPEERLLEFVLHNITHEMRANGWENVTLHYVLDAFFLDGWRQRLSDMGVSENATSCGRFLYQNSMFRAMQDPVVEETFEMCVRTLAVGVRTVQRYPDEFQDVNAFLGSSAYLPTVFRALRRRITESRGAHFNSGSRPRGISARNATLTWAEAYDRDAMPHWFTWHDHRERAREHWGRVAGTPEYREMCDALLEAYRSVDIGNEHFRLQLDSVCNGTDPSSPWAVGDDAGGGGDPVPGTRRRKRAARMAELNRARQPPGVRSGDVRPRDPDDPDADPLRRAFLNNINMTDAAKLARKERVDAYVGNLTALRDYIWQSLFAPGSFAHDIVHEYTAEFLARGGGGEVSRATPYPGVDRDTRRMEFVHWFVSQRAERTGVLAPYVAPLDQTADGTRRAPKGLSAHWRRKSRDTAGGGREDGDGGGGGGGGGAVAKSLEAQRQMVEWMRSNRQSLGDRARHALRVIDASPQAAASPTYRAVREVASKVAKRDFPGVLQAVFSGTLDSVSAPSCEAFSGEPGYLVPRLEASWRRLNNSAGEPDSDGVRRYGPFLLVNNWQDVIASVSEEELTSLWSSVLGDSASSAGGTAEEREERERERRSVNFLVFDVVDYLLSLGVGLERGRLSNAVLDLEETLRDGISPENLGSASSLGLTFLLRLIECRVASRSEQRSELDGSEWSPFCLPLLDEHFFEGWERPPPPNNYFPSQIPWPEELVSRECVNAPFTGDRSLLRFREPDYCSSLDRLAFVAGDVARWNRCGAGDIFVRPRCAPANRPAGDDDDVCNDTLGVPASYLNNGVLRDHTRERELLDFLECIAVEGDDGSGDQPLPAGALRGWCGFAVGARLRYDPETLTLLNDTGSGEQDAALLASLQTPCDRRFCGADALQSDICLRDFGGCPVLDVVDVFGFTLAALPLLLRLLLESSVNLLVPFKAYVVFPLSLFSFLFFPVTLHTLMATFWLAMRLLETSYLSEEVGLPTLIVVLFLAAKSFVPFWVGILSPYLDIFVVLLGFLSVGVRFGVVTGHLPLLDGLDLVGFVRDTLSFVGSVPGLDGSISSLADAFSTRLLPYQGVQDIGDLNFPCFFFQWQAIGTFLILLALAFPLLSWLYGTLFRLGTLLFAPLRALITLANFLRIEMNSEEIDFRTGDLAATLLRNRDVLSISPQAMGWGRARAPPVSIGLAPEVPPPYVPSAPPVGDGAALAARAPGLRRRKAGAAGAARKKDAKKKQETGAKND